MKEREGTPLPFWSWKWFRAHPYSCCLHPSSPWIHYCNAAAPSWLVRELLPNFRSPEPEHGSTACTGASAEWKPGGPTAAGAACKHEALPPPDVLSSQTLHHKSHSLRDATLGCACLSSTRMDPGGQAHSFIATSSLSDPEQVLLITLLWYNWKGASTARSFPHGTLVLWIPIILKIGGY